MRGKSLLTPLLALALFGLACSDSPGEPSPEAAPSPSASPVHEPPPVCPLTGEKPSGVKLERPAVAVKISNSPDARPQTGLDKADIVYEEVVEGGITRFLAIFHCHSATKVGPVRSARFDDPKIALPFTHVLSYSGSNAIVDKELARRKMVQLTELNGGASFFRVPPGTLNTHNLFANPDALRKLALSRRKKLKGPSDTYFDFGDIKGKAATGRSVALHFNPNIVIEWRYRGGEYKRFEGGSPFMAAGGRQVGARNVLVQEVEVNNSKTIVDVAGNPSPDISLTGSGRALLFRNGKVIKGKWTIRKEGSPPVFKTKSGKLFSFAVGSTWIELVPAGKGSVKGSITLPNR